MSEGMAGVIAAHKEIENLDYYTYGCRCGWKAQPADEHPDHLAEELAKAGYGNAQEVLLAAADEMPIETLGGADKASVWLRNRATRLEGGA